MQVKYVKLHLGSQIISTTQPTHSASYRKAQDAVALATMAVPAFLPAVSLTAVRAPARRAACSRARAPPSARAARVALTREPSKNGALRRALEEAAPGAEVVDLPVVRAVRAAGRSALAPALRRGGWAWAVVTSPEAAAVFAEEWSAAGRPPVRAAAVGAATARVLEAAGVPVEFVPRKATGRALAEEMPPAREGEAVLYPASALASGDVVTGLERKGYAVKRLDTYSTAPAEWDERQLGTAAGVDVVTFAAPSAVKAWIANAGLRDGVRAACIGETSAAAARDAGFSPAAVFSPSSPGLDGWVTAVGEALDATAAGQR